MDLTLPLYILICIGSAALIGAGWCVWYLLYALVRRSEEDRKRFEEKQERHREQRERVEGRIRKVQDDLDYI